MPIVPPPIKKVHLLGPESSGKTTLAQDLAEYYGTVWAEEFARWYLEDKHALEPADFEAIHHGQRVWEEMQTARCNGLLICDTDPVISARIWKEIYLPLETDHFFFRLAPDPDALYLLMDIDNPWEQDGTREFPELRQWHFLRLRRELDRHRIRYHVISGPYAARLEQAVSLIDRYLATSH